MIEYTPKHNSAHKTSSDRTFGLVFAVVFGIISCRPFFSGGMFRWWAMIVAGVFLLSALFNPRILTPANRLWMKFGDLLHRMVSPTALAIVFYVAVMPTGLIMRLLGKDLLRLRFDAAAESYWIHRDPPGPAGDSLNNQF